jgi:uncharacterized protein (TIGR02996 family)
MPLISPQMPKIDVQVPVPQPVAPAPAAPQPVPSGGVAPAIPPAPPPVQASAPHAFILPWMPPPEKVPPQQMRRHQRVIRYAAKDPLLSRPDFVNQLREVTTRKYTPHPDIPDYHVTVPADGTGFHALADHIGEITGDPDDPRAQLARIHGDTNGGLNLPYSTHFQTQDGRRLGSVNVVGPRGGRQPDIVSTGYALPHAVATKKPSGLRLELFQDERKNNHGVVRWVVPAKRAGHKVSWVDVVHVRGVPTPDQLRSIVDKLPDGNRQEWEDFAARFGIGLGPRRMARRRYSATTQTHAFILPWMPPPKKVPPQQMRRNTRVVRYSHNQGDFVRNILLNPDDSTAPMAFADWYEDQGLTHTGQFLRAHTDYLNRSHGNSKLNWRFNPTTGWYLDHPNSDRHVYLIHGGAHRDKPFSVTLGLKGYIPKSGKNFHNGNATIHDLSSEEAHDWAARLVSEGASVDDWMTKTPEYRKAVRRLNKRVK